MKELSFCNLNNEQQIKEKILNRINKSILGTQRFLNCDDYLRLTSADFKEKVLILDELADKSLEESNILFMIELATLQYLIEENLEWIVT